MKGWSIVSTKTFQIVFYLQYLNFTSNNIRLKVTLSIYYLILAATSLEASSRTLNVFLFHVYVALILVKARIFFKNQIFCNFSSPLLQNSFKPSRDLWEATLLRTTRLVQRLARSFSIDKQTNIMLLYYKDQR